MADDKLSAALEEIKVRNARVTMAAPLTATASAEDVPRLLAAVGAVLKLADEYDAESKRLWGQIREADRRGVMTGSKSIDAAWNGDVARAIREAIDRELTGEVGGGG